MLNEYEVYRLTLDHYIQNGDSRIKLDEPLVIQMIYDRSFPSSVCINEMLDRLRCEVLKRQDKFQGG